MKNHTWFGYILTLLFMISCSNEIDQRPEEVLGYDYYPLALGKFIEYQVDSTIYDNLGLNISNSSSFIREEISDIFINGAGEEVYVLDMYWKKSLSDTWQLRNVWWITRDAEKAIRTEENLSFIKIVFPPKLGTTWDGNAFINERLIQEIAGESIEVYKNWDYEIILEVENETIGLTSFDNVITIQQADNENVIERRYSIEKYAKGVGLVYREMMILDTQCTDLCSNQNWEEKAEKGFILKQTVVKYN